MSIEKRIEKNIEEIVCEIRDYFKEQKEDWQKIPWLALHADGRGGYSSFLDYMYRYGVLRVEDDGNLAVDLETGDLVKINLEYKYIDVFARGDGDKFDFEIGPCGKLDVLRLIPRLGNLNAKNKIRQLEESCKLKDNIEYGGTEFKTNKEWRDAMIEQYGLEKDKYSRRKNKDE